MFNKSLNKKKEQLANKESIMFQKLIQKHIQVFFPTKAVTIFTKYAAKYA